jgi:hypothetical protein
MSTVFQKFDELAQRAENMSLEDVVAELSKLTDEEVISTVKRGIDSIIDYYTVLSGEKDGEFRLTDFFKWWKWRYLSEASIEWDLETLERLKRENASRERIRDVEEEIEAVRRLLPKAKDDPDCWMRTGGYFPLEPIIPNVSESVLKQLKIPRGYVVHDILVSRLKREEYERKGLSDLAEREREREEWLLKVYSESLAGRKSPQEIVSEVMELRGLSLEQMMEEAADIVGKEFAIVWCRHLVEKLRKEYKKSLVIACKILTGIKVKFPKEDFETEVRKFSECGKRFVNLPISISILSLENFFVDVENFILRTLESSVTLQKDRFKFNFMRRVGVKIVKYVTGREFELLGKLISFDEIRNYDRKTLEYPECAEARKWLLKYVDEEEEALRHEKEESKKEIGSRAHVVANFSKKLALYMEVFTRYLATKNPAERSRLEEEYHTLQFNFVLPYIPAYGEGELLPYPKAVAMPAYDFENQKIMEYDFEKDVAKAGRSIELKGVPKDPRDFYPNLESSLKSMIFFFDVNPETFEVKFTGAEVWA